MKTIRIAGFTLIELLAVITVLALILLLAVPTILSARENTIKGINNAQKKNMKYAGETLGIDLDDYMSGIYNCSAGWVTGKCILDDNGKWSSISVTLDELIDHDYFQDIEGHCSGEITVTKESSGYGVDYNNIVCE